MQLIPVGKAQNHGLNVTRLPENIVAPEALRKLWVGDRIANRVARTRLTYGARTEGGKDVKEINPWAEPTRLKADTQMRGR